MANIFITQVDPWTAGYLEAISDPTERGQGSNPRTDGQSGFRESLPACFPLGLQSRWSEARRAAQQAPWAARIASKGSVCFPCRLLPAPGAGYHLLLWLPGEPLATDEELWKLSGKVGRRGDTQVGSAREESLAEEGGSSFTHSPASGMGETWERLGRRQEFQLIPCSFPCVLCFLSLDQTSKGSDFVLGAWIWQTE